MNLKVKIKKKNEKNNEFEILVEDFRNILAGDTVLIVCTFFFFFFTSYLLFIYFYCYIFAHFSSLTTAESPTHTNCGYAQSDHDGMRLMLRLYTNVSCNRSKSSIDRK